MYQIHSVWTNNFFLLWYYLSTRGFQGQVSCIQRLIHHIPEVPHHRLSHLVTITRVHLGAHSLEDSQIAEPGVSSILSRRWLNRSRWTGRRWTFSESHSTLESVESAPKRITGFAPLIGAFTGSSTRYYFSAGSRALARSPTSFQFAERWKKWQSSEIAGDSETVAGGGCEGNVRELTRRNVRRDVVAAKARCLPHPLGKLLTVSEEMTS